MFSFLIFLQNVLERTDVGSLQIVYNATFQ